METPRIFDLFIVYRLDIEVTMLASIKCLWLVWCPTQQTISPMREAPPTLAAGNLLLGLWWTNQCTSANRKWKCSTCYARERVQWWKKLHWVTIWGPDNQLTVELSELILLYINRRYEVWWSLLWLCFPVFDFLHIRNSSKNALFIGSWFLLWRFAQDCLYC